MVRICFSRWGGFLAASAIVFALSTELLAIGMGVTITEILYHPAGANEAALEFVEIYNQDPTPFDLSGYRFSKGILFEFAPQTFIAGHSYLAVASNQDALRALHPQVAILGNFSGRLDNKGEELVLANPAGVPVARVDYNDAGRWPHAADGTGHSLALRSVNLDPSESESWTWSAEMGGTPGRGNFPAGVTFLDRDLIPDLDAWSYAKGTAAPSSPLDRWRQQSFDDSAWQKGPAGFGYGDDDDQTVLGDMANGYYSVFIRHRFNLLESDLEGDESLVLLLSFDDAFIAYLNGAEAARTGIGSPGDSTPFDAPASISHEAAGFEAFTLPKSLLEGDNVLGLEGHNASLTSSDFSLRPVLIRRRTLQPQPLYVLPVVLNELYPGEGIRWLELFNTSSAAADLSGYWLSNDPGDLKLFAFPPGTSVPARGHLTVTEAQLPFPLAPATGEDLSIFLSAPSGDRVAGAQRFSMPAESAVSIARYTSPPLSLRADAVDGGNEWSQAADPTPGAANQVTVETDVVINEINYHPHHGSLVASGNLNASLEFIELFNRSSRDIDLSGWAFTKGVRYNFAPGTVLPAGGYLVVAADPPALQGAHGLSGALGPYEGVLADDGERLVLEDARGNIADEVRYRDDGIWSRWADGGGSSLELIDPWQDNGPGSAWAASDESKKAPWKTVIYPSVPAGGESEFHIILQHRGTVLLDEIKVSGNGVANYLPNGHFDANTSGWVFEGTHVHARRTAAESFAGAGALELTSSGRGDSRVNKIEADTSPALPGNVTLNISYAARWVRGTNLVTTRGSNHGFPKTIELPVPKNTGTPGARNSTAQENLGPVIDGVRQEPIVADAAQPVRVLARISDSDGVASALVQYKQDGTLSSFIPTPLLDDGQHGDGRAGDGLYAGEIPGIAAGAKVLYYLEAADALGAARTFPVESPQRPLMYQVDTPSIQSPAPQYRIILSNASTQTLQSRKALSNDLLDGTFVFESGEAYYNVGVRYRGSPWLRPGNPKSYRVRLNKDAPFHGWRKINLDVTGWELRERAAFYMIRYNSGAIKVPYSQQSHAVLRFNGSRLGLYEHVQQVDTSYVDTWFPGDNQGNLFKIDMRMDIDDSYNTANVRNLALDYINNDEEQYRYNFSPRSNEEKDNFGNLIALARLMDPAVTNDAAFRQQVEKLVDVEEWMRILAVRIFNDDWDTYGLGAKNAYLYHASVEGRWKLLPWDSDNTFGNINAPLWPNGFYAELVRLFNTPAYRRLYFRFIDFLATDPQTSDHLSAYLDRTRAAMQAEGVGNPAGIYSFLSSRSPLARAILPASAAFKITSPNPLTTSASETTLQGTAPYQMAALLLGEKLAQPDWTQVQSWTLTLAVHPGDNPIDLFAFDDAGNMIGSASTLIRSTAVWDPPVVTAVAPAEGPEEGGNPVTVLGEGFQEGAQVLFGLKASPQVTLVQVPRPFQPPRRDLLAEAPPGEGTVDLTVLNADGKLGTLPFAYTYQSLNAPFRRGDLSGDGAVEIADAIAILEYLFKKRALLCPDAADANDNGAVDIADAVRLLLYLFKGAAAPPPPFDAPGIDPTPDPLVCRG
ncbi:MAG: lamin tail domain-containing protein [Planctomycetes bacterium]|nr:lamin tail domain-containing protein [Planctomycetota bacterium]